MNFSNAHPAPAHAGNRISGDHLVGGERGLEEAEEEVVGGDRAGARPGPATVIVPPSASTAAGRSDAGSPWASEPPSVPRWRTCGSPTGSAAGAQQREVLARARRWLDQVAVAGEATDDDVVAVEPRMPARSVTSFDVDQDRRRRQPQLHERQQRVAAGEELGLVAVLGQRGDGLVDAAGADVVERRRGSSRLRPRCVAHRRAGDDRGDDVVVAGAAAQVALEPDAHVALGRGCRARVASDTAAITMPGVQ